MKNTILISLSILGTSFFACTENKPTQHTENSTPSLEVTGNPDSLSGKNTYKNPVDGNTYASDKKWKTYTPDKIKIDTGIVKGKNVTLLTEQSKFKTLMGIEKVAGLIQKIDTIVENTIGETDKIGEILVQITVTTNGPKVKISARDEVDEDKISNIFPEIEKLTEYKTKYDSLIFQSHYTINK